MEDLRSIVVGTMVSFMVLGIAKAYGVYRRKSIQSDIEFVEFERTHLEAMKKSSIEMNRSSFRAIFLVLMLIAIANLIPGFIGAATDEVPINNVADILSAAIWTLVVATCFKFHQRYDDLKNYQRAKERLEIKLSKLNEKLERN